MMYPPEFDAWVQTDVGSGRNEGTVRPHFFKGVATVCTKLFNIIQPDVVYFGQKDAQQCVVIEHIVRDLNMDIQVAIVPTHRESDGLAMSSRNAYLSPDERALALGREHQRVELARGGDVGDEGHRVRRLEDGAVLLE